MRTVIVGCGGVGDWDRSRERLAEVDVGMVFTRDGRPRKLKTGTVTNPGLTHAVDCGEALGRAVRSHPLRN